MPDPALLDTLAQLAAQDGLDPAFRALVLRPPGGEEMARHIHAAGAVPDPQAIHDATEALTQALARRMARDLPALRRSLALERPFRPDADGAGRRALGLVLLGLQSRLDAGAAARTAFYAATNMTEEVGALASLLAVGAGEAALASFRDRWRGDRLTMDKWFSLQVLHADPSVAAQVADGLTRDAAFDWKNPNRFRAVVGALSGNPAGFHAADGAGYRFLADCLLRLDPMNPQTAARMSTAFETWRRYDPARQTLMRAALARIAAAPGLSRDLTEMVARMLGADAPAS